MTILFTKDCETGIAKIDQQHQELIKRINAVVELGAGSVTKEETEKTLKFLEDYIVKHFADEERIQVQYKYSKYEWHKEQHAFYINEFKKMKNAYLTNGASAKYTLELNNFMIQWIVRHIKSVDIELGKYILSQS